MEKPTATPGVAGRTNYASWDKITRSLNDEVDAEEEEEMKAAKEALGTEKYSLSQAQQDEKDKANKVLKVKDQLEQYKKRENAIMATFKDVFADSKLVRLTRNDMNAGKRVMTICDTRGAEDSEHSIVLTQDLSSLESQMPGNQHKKTFADDAENSVEEKPEMRKIYGLIKVFLNNLHNCTVHVKCKLITGTIEVHNCSNLKIVVHSTATVATLQADLSENMTVEFRDAPSGKNAAPVGSSQYQFWGQDKDDRIFHAGVSNLSVAIYRDDALETSIVSDYKKDGATAVGNATAEEMQFVTSCTDQVLTTEQVVRQGSSTGSNVRAMTQRELDAEAKRREQAVKMAVSMAEDMIQIRDKNGNLVTKVELPEKEVIEEVVSPSVKVVVDECEQNKARGNEAFQAGEYGQAILLYSLALDKAEELEDVALFPRDVVFSNRAACFLKLGQHEKAEADAASALEINPDNLKATFRQGLSLHAMGRYFEAMPILAKAHKLEPKNKQIKQALQFCEVRVQQEHRKRMQG